MKAFVGQSVIAESAPLWVRRRKGCRGYQGTITEIDGDLITVSFRAARFGTRTRTYHESCLSFLKSNNEALNESKNR